MELLKENERLNKANSALKVSLENMTTENERLRHVCTLIFKISKNLPGVIWGAENDFGKVFKLKSVGMSDF